MVRLTVALLAGAIALTACSSGATTSATTGGNYSAEVGSTDLYAKAPQRFQIGVFRSSDQGVQLLTSGAIDLQLTPFQGGPGTPLQGKAHYVGAPGTGADTGTPQLTDPSPEELRSRVEELQALGEVGRAVGSTLDLETVLARIVDHAQRLSGSERPVAIDSRAQGGAPVPDPELHRDTIAGAIAAHRAALVLFATPVYCMSQFCGPSTDALERIAKTGPKDADYIHVEIYANYDKHRINRAAAQWLLRNGDLTEPWLYLIAPNGVIADRWGPLFDPSQVMTELRRLAG